MAVAHGCLNRLVSHQLLYEADIHSRHDQATGKCMRQIMPMEIHDIRIGKHLSKPSPCFCGLSSLVEVRKHLRCVNDTLMLAWTQVEEAGIKRHILSKIAQIETFYWVYSLSMLVSTLFEVALSPGIWRDGILAYMKIEIKDIENPDDVRRAFYVNDGNLLACLTALMSAEEASQVLAGIRRDETIRLPGRFTKQQLLDMNAYRGELRTA
jgi:hypothetical protein